MHTELQCQDVAWLSPDLCLVQAIAPDGPAHPSLLHLMHLSSLEAQLTTSSLKPFSTLG